MPRIPDAPDLRRRNPRNQQQVVTSRVNEGENIVRAGQAIGRTADKIYSIQKARERDEDIERREDERAIREQTAAREAKERQWMAGAVIDARAQWTAELETETQALTDPTNFSKTFIGRMDETFEETLSIAPESVREPLRQRLAAMRSTFQSQARNTEFTAFRGQALESISTNAETLINGVMMDPDSFADATDSLALILDANGHYLKDDKAKFYRDYGGALRAAQLTGRMQRGEWKEVRDGLKANRWKGELTPAQTSSLLKQATEEQLAAVQNVALTDPVRSVQALRGGPSRAPGGSADVDVLNRGLRDTEASGNPAADRTNKDGERYVGLYQYGQARLDDYNKATGGSLTLDDLKAGGAPLQQEVHDWGIANIDAQIKTRGLTEYEGRVVDGVVMTPNAMRAVAHLGGMDGLETFLRTDGGYNARDELKTSLRDYALKHGGYEVDAASPDAPAAVDPLLDGLSPSETARARGMLSAAARPELESNLQDYMAALAAGDAEGADAVGFSWQDYAAAFADKPEHLKDVNRAIGIATMSGGVRRVAAEDGFAAAMRYATTYKPHGEGYDDDGRAMAHMVAEVRKLQEAAMKDPAAFALENNDALRTASEQINGSFNTANAEGLAEGERERQLGIAIDQQSAYFGMLDAYYDKIGIPETRRSVLPKQQAVSMAEEASALPPDKMSNWAEMMQMRYGRNLGSVIRDLEREGAPPMLMVLANTTDAKASRYLAAAIAADADKDYDPKTLLESDVVKGMPGLALGEAEDFVRSIVRAPNGQKIAGQYVEAISKTAMQIMIKNSGVSQSEAVQQAYEGLLGKQYEFVSQGSDTNPVRAPVGLKDDLAVAMGLRKMELTADDIQMPARSPGTEPLAEEDVRRFVMDNIRRGSWQTNETDDGIVLLNAEGEQVFGPDGKSRVEIKFDDLKPGTELSAKVEKARAAFAGGEMDGPGVIPKSEIERQQRSIEEANRDADVYRTGRKAESAEARASTITSMAKEFLSKRGDSPQLAGVQASSGQQARSNYGRRLWKTPDGEIVSEKTATVTTPSINGGEPTNIPTIFDGRRYTDEEAAKIIAANDGRDPETGEKLEAFASIEEAVAAARARSEGAITSPEQDAAARAERSAAENAKSREQRDKLMRARRDILNEREGK